MYEDKTLVCKDCGNEFIFTAGEQEFYAERGYENEPKRCKSCRQARKQAAKSEREYFPIICAQCGKEDKVPFEPREGGKPPLCSECFAKAQAARNAQD
jgi:CxxC-x17-CxxC domain-containing protein